MFHIVYFVLILNRQIVNRLTLQIIKNVIFILKCKMFTNLVIGDLFFV